VVFQPLGRDMELLVFGTRVAGGGVSTSGGRFYEFEDRAWSARSVARSTRQLQLYCADSVDMESWYNKQCPRAGALRGMLQYDDYLIHELVPLVAREKPGRASGFAGVQLRWIPRGECGA